MGSIPAEDEAPAANTPGETPPLAPGLYLVATPIGNLEDITLRALRVLRTVDRIACEDTRQTMKLLTRYGIATPTLSLHEHNEHARATEELVPLLSAGGRIALVSDAGMPAIADPGSLLVRLALEAGVPVFPVPGANAALAALVASGLGTERFTFHGFLPEKAGARRTALEALAAEQHSSTTHILYEAPHRILATLAEVEAVFGSTAKVVVARELTKIHEQFLRGTAAEVAEALKAADRVRGEFVLLLEPGMQPQAVSQTRLDARIAELMGSASLSEKEALKQAARERGLGKSEAYRELQRERAGQKQKRSGTQPVRETSPHT